MKKILFLVCFLTLPARAIDFSQSEINNSNLNKIANAIYQIEGGPNTKFPYGIKSINTHGNLVKARAICIRTIQNNFVRWNHNKSIDFLTFLGNVYCPRSADSQGNSNWIKNIHKLIKTD